MTRWEARDGAPVYWVLPGSNQRVGQTRLNKAAGNPFAGQVLDIRKFEARYGKPPHPDAVFTIYGHAEVALARAMEVVFGDAPDQLQIHDYAAISEAGPRDTIFRQAIQVGGGGPAAGVLHIPAGAGRQEIWDAMTSSQRGQLKAYLKAGGASKQELDDLRQRLELASSGAERLARLFEDAKRRIAELEARPVGGLAPLSPAAVRAEELRQAALKEWKWVPAEILVLLLDEHNWAAYKHRFVQALILVRKLRRAAGDPRALPEGEA